MRDAINRHQGRVDPETAKTQIQGVSQSLDRILQLMREVDPNAPLDRKTQARLASALSAVMRQGEMLERAVSALEKSGGHERLLESFGERMMHIERGLAGTAFESLDRASFADRVTSLQDVCDAFSAGVSKVFDQHVGAKHRDAGEVLLARGLKEAGTALLRDAGDRLDSETLKNRASLLKQEIRSASPEKVRSMEEIVELGRSSIPPELSSALAQLKPVHSAINTEMERLAATFRGLEEAGMRPSPELERRRDEVLARYDREVRPLTAKANRMMAGFRETMIRGSLLDAAELKMLANATNAGSPHLSPAQRKAVKAEYSDFLAMTNGKVALTVEFFEAEQTRAFTEEKGWVDIGRDQNPYHAWHELGHHMEFSSPELKAAANAFIDKRAPSGKREPLRESGLPGAHGYGEDEIARVGDFWDPYLGKVYPNGDTEVYALGLECFQNADSMVALYLKDEEHFSLTLGATRT